MYCNINLWGREFGYNMSNEIGNDVQKLSNDVCLHILKPQVRLVTSLVT